MWNHPVFAPLSPRVTHVAVCIKMSFLLRGDDAPLLDGPRFVYPSPKGRQVYAQPSGSHEQPHIFLSC